MHLTNTGAGEADLHLIYILSFLQLIVDGLSQGLSARPVGLYPPAAKDPGGAEASRVGGAAQDGGSARGRRRAIGRPRSRAPLGRRDPALR